MRSFLIGMALAAASVAPVSAAQISWTDWTGWNGTNTVNGVINDNGDLVNVTFTSTANLFPSPQFGGDRDDYWALRNGTRDASTSPYTNVGSPSNGGLYAVDNIPTDTDIIRMSSASTYQLTFDKAITDIYFAYVSLNRNAFVFNTETILLSSRDQNIDGNGIDSNGYWGSFGTSVVDDSVPGQWSLSGAGEPHGTVVMPGSFTSLTWTGGSEAWHGFTIGVASVTTPVPLPASALFLLAGLGGMAALRRRAA